MSVLPLITAFLLLTEGIYAATPFLNTYLDAESRESLRKVFEKALESKVSVFFSFVFSIVLLKFTLFFVFCFFLQLVCARFAVIYNCFLTFEWFGSLEL